MKKILVINSGSSSIKYELFNIKAVDDYEILAKGTAERIGIDDAYIQHQRFQNESVILKMELPNHKIAIKAIQNLLADPEHGVIKDINEIEGVGHRVVHYR